MKLVRTSEGGSFYESFSDLIFGALVLFIVLVLALSLKLQASVEALEVAGENLVSKSRFTGGSNATLPYISAIPGQDQLPDLVWIPHEVNANWEVPPPGGEPHLGPVIRMCEHAKKPGSFQPIPNSRIRSAGPAFSRTLVEAIIYTHPPGQIVYLAKRARELWPGEFERWTPRELAEIIGPIDLETSAVQPTRPELVEALAEYRQWSLSVDPTRWYGHIDGTKFILIETTVSSPEPWLRIRVGEEAGEVYLSDFAYTVEGVLEVLLSIKPGKGFYMEVTDLQGEAMDPPEWCIRDILLPAGYVNRVLRPEESGQ